eukprot:880387-Prorocentrum_minimum.AAC.2
MGSGQNCATVSTPMSTWCAATLSVPSAAARPVIIMNTDMMKVLRRVSTDAADANGATRDQYGILRESRASLSWLVLSSSTRRLFEKLDIGVRLLASPRQRYIADEVTKAPHLGRPQGPNHLGQIIARLSTEGPRAREGAPRAPIRLQR